eukprot:4317902-Prymnesium_polylepis.1
MSINRWEDGRVLTVTYWGGQHVERIEQLQGGAKLDDKEDMDAGTVLRFRLMDEAARQQQWMQQNQQNGGRALKERPQMVTFRVSPPVRFLPKVTCHDPWPPPPPPPPPPP